jgi:hypothetical protein
MWNMQEGGQRVLTKAEWALFREGVESLVERVEEGIRCDDCSYLNTGIPVFDRLTPEQKLATIFESTKALRDPTVPTPYQAAVNEGNIAAVLDGIELDLELELDGDAADTTVRGLIAEVFTDRTELDFEIPAVGCDDLDEWKLLLECFRCRILWDDDYAMDYLFLDGPPECTETMSAVLTIDSDYYTAIATDPNPKQLQQVRRQLKKLLSGR